MLGIGMAAGGRGRASAYLVAIFVIQPARGDRLGAAEMEKAGVSRRQDPLPLEWPSAAICATRGRRPGGELRAGRSTASLPAPCW